LGSPANPNDGTNVDCELAAAYDGGDHAIFVGTVLASGCGPAHDALLFYRGGFHRPELAQPVTHPVAQPVAQPAEPEAA